LILNPARIVPWLLAHVLYQMEAGMDFLWILRYSFILSLASTLTHNSFEAHSIRADDVLR
jgi:hypothetical protein